jgi:hypothetical protein
LVFQMASFPQVSPPKPCMHLFTHPYVLHAPPISFFSIRSPEQYLVKSTNHLAHHYVVFSAHMLPRPSWDQIFCLVPYSHTLSLRSSINVSDHVSHPYKTTGKIIVPYILIFFL